MGNSQWFRCAALLLSGVAMITTACSRGEGQTKTPGRRANADSRPSVAVAKAERADLSRKLVLTAEFAPYQEVEVMAKVAGYVKSINVDIGDRVRAGELLATLEVPEMSDDLTKAAAAVHRSAAELSRAKEELTRSESAHQIAHLTYDRLSGVMKDRPGLLAQQEVDDAHSRDLVSEAQVAAAKSALAAAEETLKVTQAEQARIKTLFTYTRVTAPFAGVITKRYADTGSMIQAGIASETQAMPVVRLSQNSLLRLILPVPESAVPKVRVGAPVTVKVQSLNRTFPGRVVRFASKIDLATRTMNTEVDVPNPDLILVPGMYAEAVITLEQHPDVLAVPIQAVSGIGQPRVMLVNAQGRIEQRSVRIGLQTPNRVEILAGLKDGDLVVLGNQSQFRAGEAVRPKPTQMAALGENQ